MLWFLYEEKNAFETDFQFLRLQHFLWWEKNRTKMEQMLKRSNYVASGHIITSKCWWHRKFGLQIVYIRIDFCTLRFKCCSPLNHARKELSQNMFTCRHVLIQPHILTEGSLHLFCGFSLIGDLKPKTWKKKTQQNRPKTTKKRLF